MDFPKRLKQISSFIRKAPREATLFLVISAVAAPIIIILSAPMQAPDESLHYWRAYELSDFDLLADRGSNERYGYAVPLNVARFGQDLTQNTNPKAKFDLSLIRKSAARSADKPREFVGFENTAIYPPTTYIPQVIGISIGKLFGLPLLFGFYAARLLNFALYVLCVYFALRLIQFGRRSLFVLALLPMSLYLAASLSPDATIIGLSFLIVSVFFKALSGDMVRAKSISLILILAILIALSKSGYFLISYLFLFIPQRNFSSQKVHNTFKLAMLLIPLATALLWSWLVLDPAQQIHTILKPQEGINPALQIKSMLADPIHFVGVLLNTFVLKSGSLLAMSLMGVFGWLDIVLPYFYYLLFPAIFLLTLSKDGADKIPVYVTKNIRLCVGALVVLVFVAISSILYIGYSPVGATFIDGLQGRYFIPVLVVATPVLIFSSLRLRATEKVFNRILVSAGAIAVGVLTFALLNANFLRIGY